MQPLPPQLLPAVHTIKFSIFDLAVPNIIAWAVLIVILLAAAWLRLPRTFEGTP